MVEVCNLINKVWLSNIFYKDTFSIINNDTLKPIFNSDIKELDKLKKVVQHTHGITRLNLDIQLGELIVNVN